MTLSEYCRKSEDAQFDLLERQGVLLAEQETAFSTIRLYEVAGFYVEVHHHHHFNVITKLQAFTTTKKLDRWLENISIDSLFQ